MTRSWIPIVVLATVSSIAGTAHAADRIVLEVYEGERASDADTVLAPVYDQLEGRGHEPRTALAAEVNTRISRDGGALTPGQIVDAQRQVEDAYQLFIDGDYPKALAAARHALQIYGAAPGVLTREPALRDLRYKALVVAARSAEVEGKGEDAFGFMAEAIRSFPGRSINSAQFDPSVSALFRRVTQELAKQGSASLEIKVDDPSTTVFVDEQFIAAGAARLDHIAPGRYRVYLAKGQQAGRVREIDVAPGAAATLLVPWSLDSVLRTADGRVRLGFDRSVRADTETEAAVAIGRAVGAKTVVVLAVRPINGRRAIVGYSISVESQSRSFAAVQIEPVAPNRETIAKLASLLAGDKSIAGMGLITVDPDAKAASTTTSSAPPHGARTMAILAGAIGVASLAGAVGFELSSRTTYDQSKVEADRDKQRSLYDSANTKYKVAQGLALGGAACIVGAAVLWFTHAPSPSAERAVTVTPAITSDGLAVFATGRF